MYTLVNVLSTNNVNIYKNLNLTTIKPIQCKSVNTALLKFMHKLLTHTTNKTTLRLTIRDQFNKSITKTITRKPLKIPVNGFKFIHYIT